MEYSTTWFAKQSATNGLTGTYLQFSYKKTEIVLTI